MIVVQINIAYQDKFGALVRRIQGNFDKLMVSETKLDDGFPTRRFVVKCFTVPYRLDRNSSDGGILVYLQENIPLKLLATTESFPRKRNGFFVYHIIHKTFL